MSKEDSQERSHHMSTKKASVYGLHPIAFIMLVPTVALSILVSFKVFLFYISIVLAEVVLKYYVKRDVKTFFSSIWKVFFGSTRLTIRN